MKFHYFVIGLLLSILSSLVYTQETPKLTVTKNELDEYKKEVQVLKEEIKKIVQEYKVLYEKLDSVVKQFEENSTKLNTTIEMVEKLSTMLSELTKKYKNLDDKVSSLYEKIEETTSSQLGVKETNEAKKEGIADVSSQYVKMRFKDKGKDVEFFLDPMYVDMRIDLPQEKKPEKQTVAQKEVVKEEKPEDIDEQKILKSVEKSIKEKKNQKKLPEINHSVLNDLHRAQKLYYAKKYNAALAAVQSSLSKQETALGYAVEGSIYYTMGDKKSARISWEKALEIDPEMYEVKVALEKILRE